MRVTFIGHASILIETRGVRILSDPWWRGPCFGAQWWTYPRPYIEPVSDGRVDYIYVSHGHHDHFHPGTLRTLQRTAKVLVSRNLDLAEPIRELGFEVMTIGDDEQLELAPDITCRLMETHAADTLFVVSDTHEVCVNLNDALHAAAEEVQIRFIKLLRSLYPRIDYVFCGYGVASHFPNCYVIPGKDREATAARRQAWFNRKWARIIYELEPRFGFPFAADVALLEDDLIWVNEPTHNRERVTTVFAASFPNSPTKVIDIAPGFVIEDGDVVRLRQREPTSLERLWSEYRDEIDRANRTGSATREGVDEVRGLLQRSRDVCLDYLLSYEGDYRFLVRFRNCDAAIEIAKTGRRLEVRTVDSHAASPGEYDVTYVTRLPYVKWSLTSPYGHEILFVGSGGIFEYRDRKKATTNLHRELMTLLAPHGAPLPARRRQPPGPIRKAKQVVKRLLGRDRPDLYDLSAWTAFGA